MAEQHFEKRRYRRLAQSLEGSHRRGHFYSRDDGLLQAADELAGGTKQRSPDRLGVAQASCLSGWRASRLRHCDLDIMRVLVITGAGVSALDDVSGLSRNDKAEESRDRLPLFFSCSGQRQYQIISLQSSLTPLLLPTRASNAS